MSKLKAKLQDRNRVFRNFTIETKKEAEDNNNYLAEGYAVVFEQETVLYEHADGTKIKEIIHRTALDEADLSDVIFNYDHEGKVFAGTTKGIALLQNKKQNVTA